MEQAFNIRYYKLTDEFCPSSCLMELRLNKFGFWWRQKGGGA